MLPMAISRPQSPKVPTPLRYDTIARGFALFIERSEVKIAILRLNDLGVDLDLAFAIAIESGIFELTNHVAAIRERTGLGRVFEEMRRSAVTLARDAEPNMPR